MTSLTIVPVTLAALLVIGCTPKVLTVSDSAGGTVDVDVDVDVDGDGHPAGDDCDDDDGEVHPDAQEVCDGIDNDCDGTVDEPADLLGSSAACPAEHCLDAVNTLTTPADGLIWIDGGSGNAPWQAWCDMGTHGGGWTLVMRCVEDYIDYDDALWEDTELLEETVFDFTAPGCSKYPAYSTVAFSELRSSYPTDLGDDFVEDLGSEYDSALVLFAGEGWEISGDFQDYFNGMMDPYAQEWGCTDHRSYGINQRDYLGTDFLDSGSHCDWNGGTRWGQRVNADHNETGNHAGQGWGAYSTIGYSWSWAISQLMWVR